jgi:hypothetical protein
MEIQDEKAAGLEAVGLAEECVILVSHFTSGNIGHCRHHLPHWRIAERWAQDANYPDEPCIPNRSL